jgi:uncharacterized protein DUF3500
MKLSKIAFGGLALASFTGLALLAQQATAPGTEMVEAAQKFLAGLSDEQKGKAIFDFDSKERFNWNFTPQQDNATRRATRKGLPLEDMTDAQKKAALQMVRAGTSKTGNVAAVAIMSLESILHDTEKNGMMIRNPQWYFFTVFGTPAKTGKWGWRVEGHHLSLNFTMDGDQVVAATPAFFGANPAEIQGGKKKGYRTLAPAEDYARELLDSLSEEQKQVAHQSKHLPEPGEKTLNPKVGRPVGLAADKLNESQRGSLMKLLRSYTERMPPAIAAVEYKLAQQAPLEKIFIAYSGELAAGKAHTYRVHGPTFIVEFLNTQADGSGNPANHIHSAWRRLQGDFGLN